MRCSCTYTKYATALKVGPLCSAQIMVHEFLIVRAIYVTDQINLSLDIIFSRNYLNIGLRNLLDDNAHCTTHSWE